MCRTLLVPAAAALLLLGAGCQLAYDHFGSPATITEEENLQKEPNVQDDRLEDKHPVFDPDLVVTETFGSCEVQLNKSGSITRLDVVPFAKEDASVNGALFRSRKEAIAAIDAISGADLLPSMDVVNGAMKPFNDGLYAAIELAAQDGIGSYMGKRALLKRLHDAALAALADATPTRRPYLQDAAAYLAAALMLGGESPSVDSSLQEKVNRYRSAFDKMPLFARPMGFYTWTPELEKVFRQDRFLQDRGGEGSDDPFGRSVALAVLLESDPELAEAYETTLALYAGLTNPYASYTLAALWPFVDGFSALDDVRGLRSSFEAAHPPVSACPNAFIALLPTSRAKDSEHFCSLPELPPNMINALIDAIRSGALDLAPGSDSGWYDFQLYALETMLVPERGPESDHLLLTAAYKKKLIETFKSLITQTRETHAKQLESAADLSAPLEVDIFPLFPAEPFPTFYLRTARAYRFLKNLLPAVLGPESMQELRSLRESQAASAEPLGAELERMAELLYGLHALTCDSLGMRPESYLLAEELAEHSLEASRARARAWLAGWRNDADVLSDPRVILPVGYSTLDRTARYWATIGVKVYKASAEFIKDFEPKIVGGRFCTVRKAVPHTYYLLSEQMVEVKTRLEATPPNRTEFRKICDTHKTPEAIVQALERL